MDEVAHLEKVIENHEREIASQAELIAEAMALLREADRIVIWEQSGMGRDFQERVEAVLYIGRESVGGN